MILKLFVKYFPNIREWNPWYNEDDDSFGFKTILFRVKMDFKIMQCTLKYISFFVFCSPFDVIDSFILAYNFRTVTFSMIPCNCACCVKCII